MTARVTVGTYYEGWIARQRPPLGRPGQERDYREAEASAQLAMLDVAGGAKTSTSGRGLTVNVSEYATQGTSPMGFALYYALRIPLGVHYPA